MAKVQYPAVLRRVSYHDAETDKRFVFLTNCFDLPALTIAELYKCRWQIELFFKWIKQHLHIKAFFGASENAVKTQTARIAFGSRPGHGSVPSEGATGVAPTPRVATAFCVGAAIVRRKRCFLWTHVQLKHHGVSYWHGIRYSKCIDYHVHMPQHCRALGTDAMSNRPWLPYVVSAYQAIL